jgi:hypothetical protein
VSQLQARIRPSKLQLISISDAKKLMQAVGFDEFLLARFAEFTGRRPADAVAAEQLMVPRAAFTDMAQQCVPMGNRVSATARVHSGGAAYSEALSVVQQLWQLCGAGRGQVWRRHATASARMPEQARRSGTHTYGSNRAVPCCAQIDFPTLTRKLHLLHRPGSEPISAASVEVRADWNKLAVQALQTKLGRWVLDAVIWPRMLPPSPSPNLMHAHAPSRPPSGKGGLLVDFASYVRRCKARCQAADVRTTSAVFRG